MKTLTELKTHYDTVLLGELTVLESQRKTTVNRIMVSGGVVAGAAFILFFFLRRFDPVLIFIPFVLIGIIVHAQTRTYVRTFKTTIIEKIVTALDEHLRYEQSHYIPQAVFSASQIFQQRIDRYHGEDYISGILGKTQIEFSEIHAQHRTRDSKGRTHYHTIFKGLFFIADFNKHFHGTTVVLPDIAERFFGQLGSMLQSWNLMRGQLIKLEDPEFEKSFAVYGDDQIEARYILSTSLMQRIVNFKQKTHKNISLSFVGSKIFMAIPYTRNLFEPRLFSTLIDFAPIQQYFEDLQLAVGLVEDLNLNTRIWSKQ